MTTPSSPAPRTTTLDRLRVPSTSGRNKDYLDGIRALAVLMILVRHSWGLSGQPVYDFTIPGTSHTVRLGDFIVMFYVGVDLFFVLSGFLLAQPFMRAAFREDGPPGYRPFMRQRLLRIVPPYWGALLIVLLFMVPAYIPAADVYSKSGLLAVLAHVFFLQVLFPVSFGSWGVGSPFWTISLEMIFYVTLPFVVRAFVRRRWLWALPVSLAITFGWLWLCRYSMDPLVRTVQGLPGRSDFPESATRFMLSHQLPGVFFDFAVGMTAANIVVRKEMGWRVGPRFTALTSRTAGLVYTVAGFAIVIGMMWWNGNPSVNRQFYDGMKLLDYTDLQALRYYFGEMAPFGLGFGLVILGVTLASPRVQKVFGVPPLAAIGILGFSLYLFHMPLYYIFNSLPFIQALPPKTHFPALFAMTGLTLVFCIAYFFTVERRFMIIARMRPRLQGPDPTPPADPPASDGTEADRRPDPSHDDAPVTLTADPGPTEAPAVVRARRGTAAPGGSPSSVGRRARAVRPEPRGGRRPPPTAP